MNKIMKQNIINSFLEDYNRSSALFIINFKSIKVSDVSSFRKLLHPINGKFSIVKNTLLIRGAETNQAIGQIKNHFSKQIAVINAFDDSFIVAQKLNNFMKKFESITFKVGIINDKIIDSELFGKFAKIGKRETLHAQLCGILKTPINKLVCTLNEIIKKNQNNE